MKEDISQICPLDLGIRNQGSCAVSSPVVRQDRLFVNDTVRVSVVSRADALDELFRQGKPIPSFEMAGPRKLIYFNPSELTCGVVTCGGLCPGLNDVIRTITLTLHWQYGVKRVLGFRYGYEGLSSNRRKDPLDLTPDVVDNIQHRGGSILGSSRGEQDLDDMLKTLNEYHVRILFVIGGDGTFRGAHRLSARIAEKGEDIAVVAVPKTIDNDISCSEQTFGFHTAVEEARQVIASAHEEAKAIWNGIGLVKLMGRDSGFIAAAATMANSDVNFCLIPENPFQLNGENGLLVKLQKRLDRKHHAVIVVAEGAGQELMTGEFLRDQSGNGIYRDIGIFLKQHILSYFQAQNYPIGVKYIDPSYIIRSCAANAFDSSFCILLGENAVHAGMAGKTDMFVGYWNGHFTHVPLSATVDKRKNVNLNGEMWQAVVSMTE